MSMYRPLSETKFINDANLVSYWKLENLNDEKGVNNLTSVNSPSVVAGKYNNCYSFNKASTQYLHTSGSVFSGTGAYTVSFWIAPTKITSDNVIECVLKPFGDNTTTGGSLFFIYGKAGWSGQAESLTVGVHLSEAYSTVNRTTDQWYHITYVHTNATTNNLYINGVNQTINNSSVLNNRTITSGKCSIGARYESSADIPSTCKIDDVAIFNRALSSTEVSELYQGLTLGEYLGAGSSITKGLYHLNGNSTDASGNGNNGTDSNVTYSLANGKFGQGAGFNGSSSKIIIPESATLRPNNVTVSAWVNPTSTTGQRFIFDSTSASPYYGYNMYILNNKLVMETYGGSNHDILGAIDIPLNVYSHVICTYDGTTMRLYVNGKADNTSTASSGNINYSTTVNPAVGSRYNGASYFAGTIDEVIIENVARSPEKIKRYYSMAKGRYGSL